jgi:predicted RNase H-like HicB family nuclease
VTIVRATPTYSFRTSWSEEDGECVATCDELPGLSGLAPTPGGALQQLRVAVAAWLDYLASQGRPAPPPAPPSAKEHAR